MAGKTKEELVRLAEEYGIDPNQVYQELAKQVAIVERALEKKAKPNPARTAPRQTLTPAGATLTITPRQGYKLRQNMKYEQILGDEFEVIEHDHNSAMAQLQATATEEPLALGDAKGKPTGEVVKAVASMPKFSNGITFQYGVDLFPIITDPRGEHSGYLWSYVVDWFLKDNPEFTEELTKIRGEYMINNRYAIPVSQFQAWAARNKRRVMETKQ